MTVSPPLTNGFAVYNGENFMSEALDGLLAEKYDYHLATDSPRPSERFRSLPFTDGGDDFCGRDPHRYAAPDPTGGRLAQLRAPAHQRARPARSVPSGARVCSSSAGTTMVGAIGRDPWRRCAPTSTAPAWLVIRPAGR